MHTRLCRAFFPLLLAIFVPHSPVLFAAPAVARTHVINELSGVDPGTKMMQYNVPIDALWAPVAGMQNVCVSASDVFAISTPRSFQDLPTRTTLVADWQPLITSSVMLKCVSRFYVPILL